MNAGVPMASVIVTKNISRSTMLLGVGAWAWGFFSLIIKFNIDYSQCRWTIWYGKSRRTLHYTLQYVSWPFTIDTIYACQDKRDDAQAGVKSTALLFGDWIKPLLSLFGMILMSCLSACGILNQAGLMYFVMTVGGGTFLLVRELWQVNLDNPKSCWETVRFPLCFLNRS